MLLSQEIKAQGSKISSGGFFRLKEHCLHNTDIGVWGIYVNGEMDRLMHGTGWTLESYTSVVDKPILEKRQLVRSIKLKRWAYVIIGYIISIILGVCTGILIDTTIMESIILCISACNITTLSAVVVFDQIWPWPFSYWRNYE